MATGAERWLAERVLDQIGVRGWFDAIVCGDEVERAKPDPQTYLAAAHRLGVRPDRCRVYEDTDLGLESARRAGMETVDVRNLYAPPRITEPARDAPA